MLWEATGFVFARRATYNRMRRDERGVALVEFALLLPFLALLVFGTVDVGRAYSLQNRLKNASREGAAYAQLHPSRVDCGSGESIASRVKGEDAGLASQVTITVLRGNGSTVAPCTPSSVVVGEKLRVRVASDFDVLTPFVGIFTGDPINLKATTEVIVQ